LLKLNAELVGGDDIEVEDVDESRMLFAKRKTRKGLGLIDEMMNERDSKPDEDSGALQVAKNLKMRNDLTEFIDEIGSNVTPENWKELVSRLYKFADAKVKEYKLL
jgi:hypothetical protein